jgi:hypothetical protein
MEHLTKDTFLEKVFNFEKNKEWKFDASCPALLIFMQIGANRARW